MSGETRDGLYLAVIREANTIQAASSGILKEYFKPNKNRKGKLALETGLSFSHITKFEQGDFTKKPYYDTVALIFGKHILSKENFSELTEKFYPDIGMLLEKYYSEFPKPTNDTLNKLLRTQTGSLVFQLINNRTGSSRKRIEELYSQKGLDILDKFLESDYFQEINNRIKPKHEQVSHNDKETISRMVTNTISDTDTDKWMTESARIFNLHETVSNDGHKLAVRKMINCLNDIKREILYNPKYFGDIPLSINLTAQVLDDTKLER